MFYKNCFLHSFWSAEIRKSQNNPWWAEYNIAIKPFKCCISTQLNFPHLLFSNFIQQRLNFNQEICGTKGGGIFNSMYDFNFHNVQQIPITFKHFLILVLNLVFARFFYILTTHLTVFTAVKFTWGILSIFWS